MYTQAIHERMHMEGVRIVDGEDKIGLSYSIFGDGDTHKRLFRTHYEGNKDLLISPTGLKGVSFQIYRALKAAKASITGAL